LVGSILIDPVEKKDSLSVKEDQVLPEFDVFQTPPEPTATYHSFSFDGLIAISAILQT